MQVHELDFSEYGGRELGLLADLLKLWTGNKISAVADRNFDADTVKAGFNDGSGSVFLFDSEYRTLVRGRNRDNTEDLLVLFDACSECGAESDQSDVWGGIDNFTADCEGCKELKARLEGSDL